MMNRVRPVLAAACAMACIGATSAPHPDPADSLAQPYARFGFDALRELRGETPNANVFISPASIAVALAMTANGAGGSTRAAILATLHQPDTPLEQFNVANRALVDEIEKTTAVRLTMANALWLQTGFAVRPQFTDVARNAYGAEVANLDFRNPAAVGTVNAWASKHTGGAIPKVLDAIDPSTIVLIANAIAFKGAWTVPFDKAATAPADFSTASGAKKSVSMMSHTARYAYANLEGVQAIRLPYADGSFAMYVAMPQDAAGLSAFLTHLTDASFDALRASLQERPGTIEFPRFSFAYDTSLNRALAALGMGDAFAPGADFGNVHTPPPPLAIGEVKHASFLSVEEAGTTAAAVTTIGIRTTAIRIEPPPFTMIVNHPFVLAIRDERSGALLFLGIIADPQ